MCQLLVCIGRKCYDVTCSTIVQEFFKIKGCSPCTCVILFKSLNDEKSGGPIKKIIRYTITEKQIEQLDNKYGIQFARSDCF